MHITYIDEEQKRVCELNPQQKLFYQSRKREVHLLSDKFNSIRKKYETGPIAVYVTGKPGIGKTQLAIEYAKQKCVDTMVVASIDATDEQTFLTSYKDLLYQLEHKHSEAKTLEEVCREVRPKLKENSGWLIIIDNLSTSSLVVSEGQKKLPLRSICPQPGDVNWGTGQVLITTSDKSLVQLRGPADTVELGPMDSECAISLLRSVSECEGQDTEAEELTQILENHPVAIVRLVCIKIPSVMKTVSSEGCLLCPKACNIIKGVCPDPRYQLL